MSTSYFFVRVRLEPVVAGPVRSRRLGIREGRPNCNRKRRQILTARQRESTRKLDSTTRELVSVACELSLPAPLRAYQWEGVMFLTQNESALLADEMGLGKTVQVAVALRVLLARRDCARVLIITPSSLRRNWMYELKRWAALESCRFVEGDARNRTALYLLPFPVLIATYDQVRLDTGCLDTQELFDLVVLDEAQRIKNRASITALAW